jgi:hypothetical protein
VIEADVDAPRSPPPSRNFDLDSSLERGEQEGAVVGDPRAFGRKR